MSELGTVTEQDILVLNRGVMVQAARWARMAGAALIVIGVIGAAAWLWSTLRSQGIIDDEPSADEFGASSFFFPSGEGSTKERIDVFTFTYSNLLFAALPLGVGVGLRLFADYAVARLGGSLTGYEPGDEVPEVVEAALDEVRDMPPPTASS